MTIIIQVIITDKRKKKIKSEPVKCIYPSFSVTNLEGYSTTMRVQYRTALLARAKLDPVQFHKSCPSKNTNTVHGQTFLPVQAFKMERKKREI